eukprot:2422914-Pyramimonas_sp.AAC.1
MSVIIIAASLDAFPLSSMYLLEVLRMQWGREDKRHNLPIRHRSRSTKPQRKACHAMVTQPTQGEGGGINIDRSHTDRHRAAGW